jgi:hypothetical protein
MYFANQNFQRRSAFLKAVRDGLPVVLFNPDIEMPAINGEVTVQGPWDVTKWDGDATNQPHGWRARVRVQDMRVQAVLA